MNAESNVVGRASANGHAGHAGTDAAAHFAHNLIDGAAKHLEVSEEKLRQTARNAEETLKTSLKAAKTKGKQARIATRSTMRRHPFAAIGLALGVGAVIALLVSGGRRVGETKTAPSE